MTASTLHMQEVGTRYRMALQSYLKNESLMSAIRSDVDAFFQRYPEIDRSPIAEQFIAGLALERITNAVLSAESAPAAAKPQTRAASAA